MIYKYGFSGPSGETIIEEHIVVSRDKVTVSLDTLKLKVSINQPLKIKASISTLGVKVHGNIKPK
jgi:hypothetical protein